MDFGAELDYGTIINNGNSNLTANNTITITYSVVVLDLNLPLNSELNIYAMASYFNGTEYWIGNQQFNQQYNTAFDTVNKIKII